MSRKKSTSSEAVMKTLKPLNNRQADYIRSISENKIIFCTGGPGTAKSYIPIAKSLEELLCGKIDQIIICRPTQEISHKGLGFTPGTLEQKYYNFIKPMEHIILEIIDKHLYQTLVKDEKIIFEPLEYMIGMTFPKNSIAILDEAEQCDTKQLRMFLTRIGGGRIVINGDEKQVYHKSSSDLTKVINALKDVDGIDFIHFLPQDTVRDSIISLICEKIDNIL